MGSHVDTPEWQSFELRMKERLRARRRRTRARWILLTLAAFAYGVFVLPRSVGRQLGPRSSSEQERPANLTGSIDGPPPGAAAVTVVRLPIEPTVLAEDAEPVATSGAAEPEDPPLAVDAVPAPALPPLEPTVPEVEAPIRTAPPDPPIRTALPDLGPAESPVPVAAVPAFNPEDVRQVIERYRDAYERLDASAAHAVWPAVDRAALARAFDGLSSQRIEFDRCDIWRDAQAALASCAGRAMFEPKVGGGRTAVAREWRFRLRRAGDRWVIESAEIR